MNTPQEIIDEFERNQNRFGADHSEEEKKGQRPLQGDGTSGIDNHPMQLTDLNTLMKLDHLVESGSEHIMTQGQLSQRLREKREEEKKPDNDLICNRCHQLKNQNKLL